MKRFERRGAGPCLVLLGLVILLVGCKKPAPAAGKTSVEISYPAEGAIFPPDIAAPAIRWSDGNDGNASWTVKVMDGSRKALASATVSRTEWVPTRAEWTRIVKTGPGKDLTIEVAPAARAEPPGAARTTVSISGDAVGASLFYREVNLPFIDAVKDPSDIRWRFGSISEREKPPVILTGLPVCGNCHSFSADGKVMGMDVDYANDKGSYVIKKVSKEIVLDKASVISWSDFHKGEQDKLTFGLLSQVSPDGRFVISTVMDRSVFVPLPDLEFSQLFFPVKGILVVYDRQAGTFAPLPGADDPEYVQSNASWSPDGKHVLFARSRAHELENIGDKLLLSQEDCEEFIDGGKKFKFDIYRVPFNEGRGGEAEPLAGASKNGLSNYFPRYSPDGKWIVFCRAESFMLLQPDSELFIIPAGGGKARRLAANTSRMNSWHSWSPNSRWLVFSSKASGPYTQLMLTHIDAEGNSSPAIELDYLTSPDRAANIPEFVDVPADAIVSMTEKFVDEVSFMRAGNEFIKNKDAVGAEKAFRKALEINPDHVDTLNNYGFLLLQLGRNDEARTNLEKAVALDPGHGEANNNLSYLLVSSGSYDEGIAAILAYLAIEPYDPIAHNSLGYALEKTGKSSEAMKHYLEAVRIEDDYRDAHCNLRSAYERLGKKDEAKLHGEKCEAQ